MEHTKKNIIMKYYKTGSFNKLIKEIEVIRQTDKCIYIKNEYTGKEDKVLKKGQFHKYFPNFDDAKNFLIDKQQKKIIELENYLHKYKIELIEILDLKNI